MAEFNDNDDNTNKRGKRNVPYHSTYSEDRLAMAVDLVKNSNWPLRTAAREMEVPKSTLERK